MGGYFIVRVVDKQHRFHFRSVADGESAVGRGGIMKINRVAISAQCACGKRFKLSGVSLADGMSYFSCPDCGSAGAVSAEQVSLLARTPSLCVHQIQAF